jgi:ParB family chromosome partitioning protein
MPTKDIPSAQSKSVPLSRLDTTDDTFRITTRTSVDDLLASLRHDGMLNPPLVIGKASDFTIVSGFRRIAACQKLGREDIPVRVLHPDIGPLKCLRIAIADNTCQRPLNLIETSRALQKLSGYVGTGKRLAESASILGLPSNLSIIIKIKDLCLLPEIIQDGILNDAISLSTAGDLKKLASDCAVAFAQLFSEFKLSLNKQREILTLVKEIARRDSISEQKVMEDRQLQDIIIDQDLDRGQKTRELRAYLRQRRFPQIVKAEAIFEYQRKQLNLGNDFKLIPPKDFEGTTYTLNMSFSSIAQLKALHTKLDRMIKHPSLKKIIERKDN